MLIGIERDMFAVGVDVKDDPGENATVSQESPPILVPLPVQFVSDG